jgi:hypothetical protein
MISGGHAFPDGLSEQHSGRLGLVVARFTHLPMRRAPKAMTVPTRPATSDVVFTSTILIVVFVQSSFVSETDATSVSPSRTTKSLHGV